MREIVLDTETTGLDPAAGHRVVEIGCVELSNHVPTGRTFHVYCNPEMAMPEEAFRIHGHSDAFLADKPKFAEIAADFVAFVDGAKLVIHNAAFDIGFLNAELKRLGLTPFSLAHAVDTVGMARSRFPGAPANLDALCRRFGIDNSARTKHGALLDAELLAEVYLELVGGRQPGLGLVRAAIAAAALAPAERPRREPRPHAPTEAELAAHQAFLAEIASPIWNQ
ncbi:MAG: DNA polymerase III subunit epsilon [Rhodospirillales bacterium]